MPPDADKLRQRKFTPLDSDVTDLSSSGSDLSSSSTDRLCTIDELEPYEVCIDGIVYDISDFDHPGGDSINVFGGNDVTVQYRMIHPYHSSKHLAKMKRVGEVTDFHCDYKFDTPFEREIKREVYKIVPRGREFGTLGWYFRAFVYIAIFFYLQYLWVTRGSSWKLAILYGLSQSAIGMNVQHDANHGACSKRFPFINELFGFGADFIGGSKWLWMEQHWTHHSFTNHAEKDPDSFGTEPFVIFNNYPLEHPRRKWIHSFQILFFLPVLSGYWISSVFNPEVLDLRQRGALGVGMHLDSDYIKRRRIYAIALRVLYIYVNAIVPFLKTGFTWGTLGNVLLMGAVESLGLAILFSLSHNFEGSDRDPTHSNNKKNASTEPCCWFKSQVETSCTYGGFLSGCLTGGLNFQIEHHLFPRMSSAWYPYIAPKVREICQKHGVRYAYYPYVWQNMLSTMKYMHEAGSGVHWKNNPLSGNL